MIDFLGQEVNEGDYVTFNESGSSITLGIVERITNKKVKVRFLNHWSKSMTDVRVKDHDAVVLVTCPAVEQKKKLCSAIMSEVSKTLSV